jgi:hypothetical protein
MQPHPPAELSQRIAEADHVVATNRNGVVFNCTISGVTVSNLAVAVASSIKPNGLADDDYKNPFVWDVAFYAGTNSLAVVHLLNHGFFQLDGVEYVDSSGIAEAFWKKLEEDRLR